MTSTHFYSSLYPFPIDLNEDDPLQHQNHQLFSFKTQPSSSSSALTCPILFNPTAQDQQAVYHQREPQQFHAQQEEKINTPQPQYEPLKSENISPAAKWMPSKKRILRTMMSSDHTDFSNNSNPNSEDHQKQQHPGSSSSSPVNLSYNNNNNNTIRVCSDCNTTKTPLWRSGPRGPKSLCNACGIRQRKARRAMAAVAVAAEEEAANDTVVAAETTPTPSMKRSSNNCVPRLIKNKKCKLINSQISQGRNKICFEELRIMLSKNSAFHQVFPQDEKEAAILLMALSYGLVHG